MSKPPPPKPPPAPSPSWPVFASKASLQADAWGAYYKAVYGDVPTNGYPVTVAENWMLYDQVLVSAGVKNIPSIAGDCPTANPPKGERYIQNSQYAPRFLSWLWHPYPYSAIAQSTWTEVVHQADPFGDEHFGLWFMNAPGSGIYFNTGKTISFNEHSDAEKHFNVQGNENMCKAAAGSGLDSVQFLAHVDHVNYQCDTKNTGTAGIDYMNIELVGVKLVGTYACGSAQGVPTSIRAGWQAALPCTCDNSKDFLNCKGVPGLQKLSAAWLRGQAELLV